MIRVGLEVCEQRWRGGTERQECNQWKNCSGGGAAGVKACVLTVFKEQQGDWSSKKKWDRERRIKG